MLFMVMLISQGFDYHWKTSSKLQQRLHIVPFKFFAPSGKLDSRILPCPYPDDLLGDRANLDR
ncbi:hypothetical protein [Planktothricoides raciborskii]|uniref:Uncharacterized protein n=1 Tax=Planktothricoides raciborskii GIHE-MW2 TaxID=2792601 RepID=A0AAU8JBN2_9CYAN